MPKYAFHCETCGKDKSMFVSIKTITAKCECGAEMQRQLPNIAQTRVTELVDAYSNVTWDDNQKANLEKRHDDHYWEIEVPRLVQTYSLQTCLENKWLVYNERNELVINKPPSKR